MRATTIIALKHKGKVALGGDGQVSLGEAILKHQARKIRKIYKNKVLAGFAGSTADAFTLYEKFEAKLESSQGNLTRAAIEVAKEWRSDKVLRRLDALLVVTDKEQIFLISGKGDVVEPDDGIVAIGSGGSYALAAARVLVKYSNLDASEIVKQSLLTAASICVYTNDKIVVESL